MSGLENIISHNLRVLGSFRNKTVSLLIEHNITLRQILDWTNADLPNLEDALAFVKIVKTSKGFEQFMDCFLSEKYSNSELDVLKKHAKKIEKISANQYRKKNEKLSRFSVLVKSRNYSDILFNYESKFENISYLSLMSKITGRDYFFNNVLPRLSEQGGDFSEFRDFVDVSVFLYSAYSQNNASKVLKVANRVPSRAKSLGLKKVEFSASEFVSTLLFESRTNIDNHEVIFNEYVSKNIRSFYSIVNDFLSSLDCSLNQREYLRDVSATLIKAEDFDAFKTYSDLIASHELTRKFTEKLDRPDLEIGLIEKIPSRILGQIFGKIPLFENIIFNKYYSYNKIILEEYALGESHLINFANVFDRHVYEDAERAFIDFLDLFKEENSSAYVDFISVLSKRKDEFDVGVFPKRGVLEDKMSNDSSYASFFFNNAKFSVFLNPRIVSFENFINRFYDDFSSKKINGAFVHDFYDSLVRLSDVSSDLSSNLVRSFTFTKRKDGKSYDLVRTSDILIEISKESFGLSEVLGRNFFVYSDLFENIAYTSLGIFYSSGIDNAKCFVETVAKVFPNLATSNQKEVHDVLASSFQSKKLSLSQMSKLYLSGVDVSKTADTTSLTEHINFAEQISSKSKSLFNFFINNKGFHNIRPDYLSIVKTQFKNLLSYNWRVAGAYLDVAYKNSFNEDFGFYLDESSFRIEWKNDLKSFFISKGANTVWFAEKRPHYLKS